MVTGVAVTILDEQGQCLEQGEAELWMVVGWEYRPAQKGRIHIEVRDMAGNVTQQEFSPSSPSFSVWEKTG